jgi:hypothetical protein
MLRAQKWRAASKNVQLGGSNGFETSQGVSLDCLGVGVIEIGRKNAPDRRQHHQEAPKRCLATPACVTRF